MQHGAHLLITHGIGTTVGEHIQKDILCVQKESIESSFPDGM
jgi:hypothetical protein